MSVRRDLGTLESSGLIRLAAAQPDLEYLFRHALVQDAAYDSLLKADRKRLHQAAGEVLEATYPERGAELAPVLARHFAEAGDDARALRYFTLAGDTAYGVYAIPEALAHYDAALNIARRQAPDLAALRHLYLRRGRALELQGQFTAALETYADLESQAHARQAPALELAALMARTTIHCTPTPAYDAVRGQALADQALALARTLGDEAAEAKILWNLLLLSNFEGRRREMIAYGEQSLALARALNLREQLALTLNDLCCYGYIGTGQYARAEAGLQEACTLWRELGDQAMLASTLTNLAVSYFFSGNLPAAASQAESAYEVSRTIGNGWAQAFSRWITSLVSMERGDIERALAYQNEGLALADPSGYVGAQVGHRVYQALTYCALGRADLARAVADRAAGAAAQLATWAFGGRVCVALVAALQGEPAAPGLALEDLITLQSEPDLFMYAPLILAASGIGLARREYATLDRVMQHFQRMLDAMAMRPYRADLLYARGMALLGLGRAAEAQALLVEARAVAESLNARRPLWPILVALSDLATADGSADEARALRAQARDVITYIAEHTGAPELRAAFMAQPAVRAAWEGA